MLGRILVAIVGVPLLIVILLFCPPVCLPVAFGALCGIGACELLQSTGAVKNKRAAFYSVVFSVGVPFWYYFGCQMIWAVGAMFLLMLLLFGEAIASKQRMKAEEIALCVFAAVLIPMMLSVFVLIADADHAKLYLLLPFVAAFTSDAFALFVGMGFGKHKLAPSLPQETVAGKRRRFLGVGALLHSVWRCGADGICCAAPLYCTGAVWSVGKLCVSDGGPVFQLYQA